MYITNLGFEISDDINEYTKINVFWDMRQCSLADR
jgi:hypothetical protein